MRLHDLLDDGARAFPEREFAVQGARHLTYDEAVATTRRLTGALIERGVGPGDRIAMLSKNSIEMVLLYFAAARAGVVPVPLNYRLAPPEWCYIVADAGARVLFATDEYREAIDGIR